MPFSSTFIPSRPVLNLKDEPCIRITWNRKVAPGRHAKCSLILLALLTIFINVTFASKEGKHQTEHAQSYYWLPVKQRIEFKLLIFVFKSLHGSAPSYLSELLHVYIPGHTGLCSANLHLLQESRSNNSFGDRSFAICAPKLWNHLPTHIKNCSTLSTFKTALKTHLFTSAFVNDL